MTLAHIKTHVKVYTDKSTNLQYWQLVSHITPQSFSHGLYDQSLNTKIVAPSAAQILVLREL